MTLLTNGRSVTILTAMKHEPKPGNPIAARREALGLSQYAVARRAGISQTNLSKIENGIVSSPGIRIAIAIADALDVIDVRQLFAKKAA